MRAPTTRTLKLGVYFTQLQIYNVDRVIVCSFIKIQGRYLITFRDEIKNKVGIRARNHPAISNQAGLFCTTRNTFIKYVSGKSGCKFSNEIIEVKRVHYWRIFQPRRSDLFNCMRKIREKLLFKCFPHKIIIYTRIKYTRVC